VAQLVEQQTPNLPVGGSSPSWPAMLAGCYISPPIRRKVVLRCP
jgi:hypothetical protein